MEEDTEYLFWAMLTNLESSCKENDFLTKSLIKFGYAHWNKLHGTNLSPTFDIKKDNIKND